MSIPIVLTIAVLPAVLLCIYIFAKDRVEKEPFGLLALLFAAGMFSCLPAALISAFVSGLIDSVFSNFAVSITAESEFVFNSQIIKIIYRALSDFVSVGLVEEGCKWLAMYLITRKSKHFNSLFDGMVYAVFVSLGFATFENIFYVAENGLSVGLLRAVTSVPAHMFFSVFMGFYYSFWHMYKKAAEQERHLKRSGYIDVNITEFKSDKFLVLSLVLSVLVHGFYDFCLFYDSVTLIIIDCTFLVFLYIYCFVRVNKFSKSDANDCVYSTSLVLKKYPQLLSSIVQSNTFIRPESLPHTATVMDIIDEFRQLQEQGGNYTGQTVFIKQK